VTGGSEQSDPFESRIGSIPILSFTASRKCCVRFNFVQTELLPAKILRKEKKQFQQLGVLDSRQDTFSEQRSVSYPRWSSLFSAVVFFISAINGRTQR
jgi:hypothetical protein